MNYHILHNIKNVWLTLIQKISGLFIPCIKYQLFNSWGCLLPCFQVMIHQMVSGEAGLQAGELRNTGFEL